MSRKTLNKRDQLDIVEMGWKAGLGALVGLAILALGLFFTLGGVSADNSPVNNNKQKQEQTQNNDQNVTVTVSPSPTATPTPTPTATPTPTPSPSVSSSQTKGGTTSAVTKSPSTGPSLISMLVIFASLPFGFLLAKFGKTKNINLGKLEIQGLGDRLVLNRRKRKS